MAGGRCIEPTMLISKPGSRPCGPRPACWLRFDQKPRVDLALPDLPLLVFPPWQGSYGSLLRSSALVPSRLCSSFTIKI